MKLLLLCCVFLSTLTTYAKEITTVESDQAHYDGKIVLLTGQVLVENSLGKIIAQTAQLKRDEHGISKIDFPFIELNENVSAQLYNGSILHCHHVSINYDSLSGIFYGNDTTQVHYCDDMGEIYANQAQISYAYINGEYKPVKITLIDQVQLINHMKAQEKSQRQYALADRVEYFFDQEEMILQANEGKRVLFFDPVKDMQLAARLVKGHRNYQTGNQAIQGIGDVRLTFKQDELDKLKKSFNIHE